MRPFQLKPFGSTLHFQIKEPRGQAPESRRIETRRDIAFQQVAKVQAARPGLFAFPGAFPPRSDPCCGKAAASRLWSAPAFSARISSTR